MPPPKMNQAKKFSPPSSSRGVVVQNYNGDAHPHWGMVMPPESPHLSQSVPCPAPHVPCPMLFALVFCARLPHTLRPRAPAHSRCVQVELCFDAQATGLSHNAQWSPDAVMDLVYGAAYRQEHENRYFVGMSLAEAETIRRILHMNAEGQVELVRTSPW